MAKRSGTFLIIRLGTAALCAAVLAGYAGPVEATSTEERQRELFRATYEQVERGDWSAVDALPPPDRQALERYVLWPDLRAAWFRATMRTADPTAVAAFLAQYGTLRPAREIRYRYALELARRQYFDAYHELYTRWYADLDIPKLDCLALQADIASGRADTVVERGRALWRIGRSQVDECDPVFEYLKQAELLRPEDYRDRYVLALDAGEFRLARWLGKSTDETHVERAQRWLDVQANPADFLAAHADHDDGAETRAQLAYAAERLTFRDPALAAELWQTESARHAFDAAQAQDVARHIALWTARDGLPDAHEQLQALDPSQADDEVWRWRARTSMRQGKWSTVLDDIAGLSAEESSADEWRFWSAIALRETGKQNAAAKILESLAEQRSYYGFLAADELGADYHFGHASLASDALIRSRLQGRTDFERARELFLVGLESRGRSEWDAAISGLTPSEKTQAALLAHQWGWHSRAIATLADINEYDDLQLRYPLVFRDPFEKHSAEARIPVQWALGIARSESLFMRDIRSPAGAVGVMQLLPSTGRSVAQELRVPWQGVGTLTNPDANIRLGTAYLASMAARYAGNRVLATAAYNAGPRRVDDWMPKEDERVDARIWIETIPYNETRGYVRRVLAAETIFHWRLTGRTKRLAEELVAIPAAASGQRVARTSR